MARRTPAPPAWIWLVAACALYAAFALHDVLIPFALSFALAYLLHPVVQYFVVRGLRRELVVLLLYGLVATTVTLAATSVIPAVTTELSMLQGRVPVYFLKVQEHFTALQSAVAHSLPFGQTIVESMSFKIYEPLMRQLPNIPTYVLGLVPFFSLIFLVPFITFFFLMDSSRFLRRAIQLLPSRYVEQALHVISEVDAALGNYIRGLLIIAVVIGSCSYIGLSVLRVDYALAISALCGLSSLIPYVGALVGMVVGALVAFFQYQNLWVPAQVVMLFVLIRLGDEAFVQPVVARRSVHLHPMAFLFALMVGGKLFGFVGLLFAVPAACVAKALVTVAWEWYVSEAQIRPPDSVPTGHPPYL